MIGMDMDISDVHEFVEFDPTGRYGRYNEILGKGASKIVYRAFDEYEGIEVAWNQVKLNDFLQSPQELERLYCEIHLLKTLKHKHIMKFYTSWVDISKRNINFVTELFTSGTLRQYRQKHKTVHIRAVKHWCRQILKGLLYLHSCDPPIIHRDLKCDNIFINGNQGVVKIGDLGLAAILRKSYAEHCVGTPEFMAPEVYEEEYNELVDIYSFGMCVLEMVTSEYPYSECTHPAQIYMKVMRGTKPEALSKVKDPEVRQFVEKCLTTASRRLPARELLMDPFLQIDSNRSGSWEEGISEMCQILRQPSYTLHSDSSLTFDGSGEQMRETRTENGWGYNDAETSLVRRHPSSDLLHSAGSMPSNGFVHEDDWDCYSPSETRGINLFSSEDESSDNVDITIKGTRGEDGSIFMRLRIPDEEGHIQNIYFPFDVENDTALDVANEMVGELDITDYEVGIIAEMIDGEVASLAPEWKSEQKIEVPGSPSTTLCNNHPSNVSIDTSACIDPQSTQNTGLDSPPAAIHEQFEERTYNAVGSEQSMNNEAQVLCLVRNLSCPLSRKSQSDNERSKFNRNNEKEIHVDSEAQICTRELVDQSESSSINHQSSQAVKLKFPCPPPIKSDEVQHELRRLSSRRQFEVKDYRNQRLGEKLLSPRPYIGSAVPSPRTALKESNEKFKRSLNFGKRFSFHIPPRRNLLQANNSFPEQTRNSHSSGSNSGARRSQHSKESPENGAENMFTAKSFYVAQHHPSSLPRARSLPQSAQGRDMRIDSCKVISVVNPVQEEISSS